MKRTRTQPQQSTHSPASRPFFSKASHSGETTPFFAANSSLTVAEVQRKSDVEDQQAEDLKVQESNDTDQATQYTNSGAVPPATNVTSNSALVVQTKLMVGQPNDKYEQEADAVAQQVMNMSSSHDLVQTKCTDCEENGLLQPQPIGKRLLQTKHDSALMPQGDTTAVSPAIEIRLQRSIGGGNPLPSSTCQQMGSTFGVNFSGVRLHTGSEAMQLSQSLGARAFTYGRDVFFNQTSYNPHSTSDKQLLAHELTHVVQQGGASANQIQTKNLPHVIQRSKLPTHFGEFEDYRYGDVETTAGNKIGVEMYMKFHPGNNARSKIIGMTQTAQGKFNGTQITQGIYGQRSATAGAGVGFFIDQLEGNRNPLYATGNTLKAGGSASNLGDYQTVGITALTAAQRAGLGVTGVNYQGWGRHGYRYVENGAYKTQTAELYDAPKLPAAGNNSEQVFETTALALEGSQQDIYYGSVQWGWRIDNKGTFTRLPFRVISQGVPSVNFLTAATIWNVSKASFGFVTTRATNLLDGSLSATAAIPNNTELEPTGRTGASGGNTYIEVNYAGNTGFVISTAVQATTIGAATVDLPVPMIHTVSNAAGTTLLRSATDPSQTLQLPRGTRVRGIKCMVPRGILTDHYEVEVVDGPNIGVRGYVPRLDLTLESVGTR